MNKKIITASAASLVLAAMPVVGAFAEVPVGGEPSATDTITVTVSPSCMFSAGGEGAIVTFGNLAIGKSAIHSGGMFTVTCNAESWELYAKGAGESSHETDLLSGENTIPTGTTLDGTASNWAMKINNGGGNPTIANGYDNWSNVPSDNTLIVNGANETTGNITTSYKVSVGSSQAPGTYTGKVTYTLVKTS